MSFFALLETLLIGPLKLIFEIVFELSSRFVGHPGLAIVMLSLVMNILILPLYRRADAMQDAARDMEAKLRDGVAHIKKTFSGDERMMILQAYYRQNHYKPTDVLHGSVSLLLEVPFFIAAYQFLSHLDVLSGLSFGPIRDLAAPDGLLVIGGVVINLLPILMTVINLVSSALYLKGHPLKTKIQLYGMALFFLIFLYGSPAGLVFYWTLNNVFSLVKTIFYKLKNAKKILVGLTAAAGLILLPYSLFIYHAASPKRKLFVVALALVLLLPLLFTLLKTKTHLLQPKKAPQPDRKLFLLGAVFLTVLVGLLVPSTVIASSPQEFVDVTAFYDPLWFIANSLCMAAGAFLVWMNVIYWIASPGGKAILGKLTWVICGAMLVDYMFFGTDLGLISANLQYENGLHFTRREQLFNLLVLFVVAAVLYFCASRWKRAATAVLLAATLAVSGMSAVHVTTIKRAVNNINLSQFEDMPSISFSKTGKNVVVVMLDRALGELVPYLMQEKPELREQFAGFTFYDNTISFGSTTNFGSPALFGGYEYTPVEMNRRPDEPLRDKHNEALRVMPVLFSDNGYRVTVCDPTYANYEWIPDLSIFDDHPEIATYITKGKFSDSFMKEQIVANNNRNFFCFGLMKTLPLCLQSTLYDEGQYIQKRNMYYEKYNTGNGQTIESMSVATGIRTYFTEPYDVLCNLPLITHITDTDDNTFLIFTNDTTHEPAMLQEPEYIPVMNVDNTAYDAEHAGRFTCDGRTIQVTNEEQITHYQANMATLLRLGDWFDYMRENGVYDNTRIILVADHGKILGLLDELVMDDGSDPLKNVEAYYPLLMFKDFDSQEFTTSHEFMTNADVPTLATSDLIEDPTNPFTGKPLNSDEKSAHEQYIMMSDIWFIVANNGNVFEPSPWASVKDDLWEPDNWTFYDEEQVLTEHAAP